MDEESSLIAEAVRDGTWQTVCRQANKSVTTAELDYPSRRKKDNAACYIDGYINGALWALSKATDSQKEEE